jgi:CheY-like chemotaxis protein
VDERVLLVEDDPSIREMTVLGLEKAGYRVTSCAEGLERLRRDPFDLAVLPAPASSPRVGRPLQRRGLQPVRQGHEIDSTTKCQSSMPNVVDELDVFH